MKHDFRKLKIWQEAINLGTELIILSKSFPKHEMFALTSQLSRASVSIPSNIAEGSSRESMKDFSRFLDISLGSSFEAETQLIMAFKLSYFAQETFDDKLLRLQKLERMIISFKNTLQE